MVKSEGARLNSLVGVVRRIVEGAVERVRRAGVRPGRRGHDGFAGLHWRRRTGSDARERVTTSSKTRRGSSGKEEPRWKG